MDGLENGVSSLAVSPTGSLAVGLDGSGRLHVWDTENGSEVLVVQTGSQEFVAFSRDGRLIYTWNSTSINVWGNP
jgi:WD40 repeat protein